MTHPHTNHVAVIRAAEPEDMGTVRELFKEYEEFLGFDLCFQGFQDELRDLPGAYAPPRGRLLLACSERQVVGCVGLRPLGPSVCEMKRLYVRPAGRGKGLGRSLCEQLIKEARELGYLSMKLDTVSKLTTAIDLYRTLGFVKCEKYCHNPQPDVEYFELTLGF